MQLTMRAIGYLVVNGERTNTVFQYEIPELLGRKQSGYIQNLDYPRDLWSILRIKPGLPTPEPMGNYLSADAALAVLQRMVNDDEQDALK